MSYSFYINPDKYAMAAQNGINERVVTARVRDLAWSIERAITTPVNYHKWGEWLIIAERNGISRSLFYSRVTRGGMSPKEASEIPSIERDTIIKIMAEKKRKYPKEYEDIAVRNGISKGTFVTRMGRGWSAEIAATTPIDTRFSKRCAL
ncbi:conserved hypothetical protein [Candidatus Desulfosporosinus infrequens]|uniref:Uncharacterized protein n=1 Tax=Candidatus Desulfosporosinus infrequens TaxID=2043169 RepID=A0A2U3LH78_9FIRM|nr:conserved hypothetical protein [Candidatus Desulfosporosinus infrequens]